MFTGIVTALGRIATASARSGGMRVTIEHPPGDDPIEQGESVAVDGCCLTAVAPAEGRFSADLSPETLARTGGRKRWRAGASVHLERSLRAGERMSGHLVQGHVDGELKVVGLRRLPDGSAVLRVELPPEGRRLVVSKGSIALDGVSLTVAELTDRWLEIALIPATLVSTTLGTLRAGDRVNVEYDILAKYAVQALGTRAGSMTEG